MSKHKEHVALTKCYFCGEANGILLATRYNSKGEPLHDLAPLHGKAVNTHPCPKCEALMKQGVIIMAVSDNTTEAEMKENPPNPYRTGQFLVVKDSAIERWRDERAFPKDMADHMLRVRAAFITEAGCKHLGLLNQDGSLVVEKGGDEHEQDGRDQGLDTADDVSGLHDGRRGDEDGDAGDESRPQSEVDGD